MDKWCNVERTIYFTTEWYNVVLTHMEVDDTFEEGADACDFPNGIWNFEVHAGMEALK